MEVQSVCIFFQTTISLGPYKRGFHLITDVITKEINNSINKISVGLVNIFLKHTSASLTINENFDSSVRDDMENISNKLVPDGTSYIHSYEGKDDMPAHFKSSMFGASLTIPIVKGELGLGTWQGIYLNEHRDSARKRKIIITIQGQK
ncbi:hypothetical protein M0811_09573 [Anaeramoeba ignava]|uniref:Secondary thiamine-phosphate synthase enzyme n=1 Tax=Anaeramoeba ignava TaxID=1746090 RepID=A0A9Q0RA70_ANAIG|nr:hypothetical protein M0811_09573 [Anaeramoeba ignava]